MTDPGIGAPGDLGLPGTFPGVPDLGLPGSGPADRGAPSLGRSLTADAGDLIIDERTGGPAEVEGLAALAQALVLAVETQLGSDRINTRFGFDRLAVGRYALGVHARKEYIKMELVRCLSADRRVTDVREVFFQDDPRYFELRPALDGAARQRIVDATRSSRDYTVFALVETVAGDTLTLESGGRLE
ncbi:hypothetical protein ACWCXK_31370 [Streptomyces sp. NPDC001739]|uniref:hypothetical protein n=1 Tax=Streptomyces sp. NPDC001633 TaxID=3364595 RepID=UPI0036C46143